MSKLNLVIEVSDNAMVARWVRNNTHRLDSRWHHPDAPISVIKTSKGVRSPNHHALSHCIQTALQYAGLRVSKLRYLSNGGGVKASKPDGTMDEYKQMRSALFSSDSDTEFDCQ